MAEAGWAADSIAAATKEAVTTKRVEALRSVMLEGERWTVGVRWQAHNASRTKQVS